MHARRIEKPNAHVSRHCEEQDCLTIACMAVKPNFVPRAGSIFLFALASMELTVKPHPYFKVFVPVIDKVTSRLHPSRNGGAPRNC
jgi:hypothetical protein